MKPFHLKAYALFLLLLPLCVARGQSNVSVIPENVSDTSIVRYWKNNICIVYACNKALKGNITSIGALTLFWERLMHPTSCGQQDAIGCVKTTAKLNDPAMATNMNVPMPFSGDTPFIVKDIHRDLICNN